MQQQTQHKRMWLHLLSEQYGTPVRLLARTLSAADLTEEAALWLARRGRQIAEDGYVAQKRPAHTTPDADRTLLDRIAQYHYDRWMVAARDAENAAADQHLAELGF